MPAGSSSREKVRRHRQRLRERGLRPIQIWVPDIRSPGFAEEARRQWQRIVAADRAANEMDWIESISLFDEDDAR